MALSSSESQARSALAEAAPIPRAPGRGRGLAGPSRGGRGALGPEPRRGPGGAARARAPPPWPAPRRDPARVFPPPAAAFASRGFANGFLLTSPNNCDPPAGGQVPAPAGEQPRAPRSPPDPAPRNPTHPARRRPGPNPAPRTPHPAARALPQAGHPGRLRPRVEEPGQESRDTLTSRKPAENQTWSCGPRAERQLNSWCSDEGFTSQRTRVCVLPPSSSPENPTPKGPHVFGCYTFSRNIKPTRGGTPSLSSELLGRQRAGGSQLEASLGRVKTP